MTGVERVKRTDRISDIDTEPLDVYSPGHTSIGGDSVARPARVVPDRFRSDHALNQLYAETEPQIIAFIVGKARTWSKRIPGSEGDIDDLTQEGRCALMVALPKFDPERRSLHVFMGGVLDKVYSKILRDVLAQKRTPHVDQWDDAKGEWVTVACPTIPIDPSTIDMGTEAQEDDLTGLIRREDVADCTDRLYDALSDVQCDVLDCYLSPEPELFFTARNLSGQYVPNVRHIAMFLKIPVTTVEYSVKKIRAEAARIVKRKMRGERDGTVYEGRSGYQVCPATD